LSFFFFAFLDEPLLASWCNSTSSPFDGFLCFFLEDDEDDEEDEEDDLLDEEEDLVDFFEICRMNSAALFSSLFLDFDFDFLCFFLRCDPDRLLELERPRDDEEDDDELEEDDVDLGKKEIKDVNDLFFKNLLLLLEILLSASLELFSTVLDLDSLLLLLLL